MRTTANHKKRAPGLAVSSLPQKCPPNGWHETRLFSLRCSYVKTRGVERQARRPACCIWAGGRGVRDPHLRGAKGVTCAISAQCRPLLLSKSSPSTEGRATCPTRCRIVRARALPGTCRACRSSPATCAEKAYVDEARPSSSACSCALAAPRPLTRGTPPRSALGSSGPFAKSAPPPAPRPAPSRPGKASSKPCAAPRAAGSPAPPAATQHDAHRHNGLCCRVH